MPLRDDFGSAAGTGRSYAGGAGGLGNGGIGGGMGGGGMGGGAGRNGGIGSQTGLRTGNLMFGGMAAGRPGGLAMNPGAWGVRPQPAIGQGPLSGMTRPAKTVAHPASAVTTEKVLAVETVPPASPVPNVFNQDYLQRIADFRNAMAQKYGWYGSNVTPGPGPMPAPTPVSAPPPSAPKYQDQVPQDPTFPGNTYRGWGTGGVGVVDPNRGWGGWNSPWN